MPNRYSRLTLVILFVIFSGLSILNSAHAAQVQDHADGHTALIHVYQDTISGTTHDSLAWRFDLP